MHRRQLRRAGALVAYLFGVVLLEVHDARTCCKAFCFWLTLSKNNDVFNRNVKGKPGIKVANQQLSVLLTGRINGLGQEGGGVEEDGEGGGH